MVCLFMGQRSCIFSAFAELPLTQHRAWTSSSIVFHGCFLVHFPLCCYFPLLYSSVWLLPLPYFWSLFFPECTFLSPASPTLQSAFHLAAVLLGQAERGGTVGFTVGGNPSSCLYFLGIWGIERRKRTRTALPLEFRYSSSWSSNFLGLDYIVGSKTAQS